MQPRQITEQNFADICEASTEQRADAQGPMTTTTGVHPSIGPWTSVADTWTSIRWLFSEADPADLGEFLTVLKMSEGELAERDAELEAQSYSPIKLEGVASAIEPVTGAVTIEGKTKGTTHTGTFLVAEGMIHVCVWIEGKPYPKVAQMSAVPAASLARTMIGEAVRKHRRGI